MSRSSIELDSVRTTLPVTAITSASSNSTEPNNRSSSPTVIFEPIQSQPSILDNAEPNEEAENPSNFPDGGRKAYSVLLGSFLGSIANLGVINSIGAVQAYVSQHQLKTVETSTVSWVFSIYLYLAYAIGLFVGPIFDRKGPKTLLIVAAFFITLGFLTAASSTNIWQFILSLSICVGIGNAIAMPPLVGVVNHWFFLKRGQAAGIATCGGSVGGLVIPLMLRYLYAKYGYQWAMRILAFFCLGCMLLSILLVEERVRKTKEYETEDAVPASEQISEISHSANNQHPSIWEKASNSARLVILSITSSVKTLSFKSLKELKYTFLICGAFCAELSLVLVVTYFATYAIAQGVSESTSYLLLAVWNSTGIVGRWLPGMLADKFGKFNMNLLMLLGFDVSIFVLWLPFGSDLKVLYAFAAIGGFFSGSILSMLPACLGQISPVRDFGQRYGLLNFFLSIGNLIGVPIGAAIIGNQSQHNYDMFVVLVGTLCSLGICFWTVSRYFQVGFRINIKV